VYFEVSDYDKKNFAKKYISKSVYMEPVSSCEIEVPIYEST